MSELKRINAFLENVNLTKYREKYAHIKLVELDMDRNVQPIRHLYRKYWEQRTDFPSFDEFYNLYSSDLKKELEDFRQEKMFSEETFYRGLPARIYRTWASLLTQIQGGYAAATIYGKNNVEMSADLDYRGIDMRLKDGDKVINIQVKKETKSREVRAPWEKFRKQERIIMVTYAVPGCDPLTPTGKRSKPFHDWQARWDGKLQRMDNGFIVFLPGMFARDYINTP